MSLVCCAHLERDVRIRIQVYARGEQPAEHTYVYCRACTDELVARYTEALAAREQSRAVRAAPPDRMRKALRAQRIQDELAGR